MAPFYIGYIAIWSAACVAAIAVYARPPDAFCLSHSAYRNFLFVPWKLVTFAVAATALTLVAPYTGDPTWDYVDALYMSALTYLGAPWTVGVLYLSVKRRLPFKHLYIALCLWMFSASWSYDLYILLRDGSYPATWLPNIFASSVLYLSAGLFWNLDWRAGRGITFSFIEPDWPHVSPAAGFSRIFWFALPFMLIVVLTLLYFVMPGLFG